MESLPYLQQKFFQELMKGEGEWMDIEEELAELGVELEGPEFAAVLLHSPIGFHDECKRKMTEITSSFFRKETLLPSISILMNSPFCYLWKTKMM